MGQIMKYRPTGAGRTSRMGSKSKQKVPRQAEADDAALVQIQLHSEQVKFGAVTA